MSKVFEFIMSLNFSEKIFLIVYCYGFGYVVGDTIKNVLGTL